ncbi:MAG: 3D domain-containing protein [Clostridia bacterium]|nr:3D domain-containing protein [Clostridia bacterium]
MSKKSRSNRTFERLCASEPILRRSLAVVVIATVVLISSFGFCIVFADDTSDSDYISTDTAQSYYVSSLDEKVLLHEEFNAVEVAPVEETELPEEILAAQEIIGSAVENIYSAVASMNLQKSMMTTMIPEVLTTAAEKTTVESKPAETTAAPVTAKPTEPEKTEPASTAAPTTAAPVAPASQETITVSNSKGSVVLNENLIPASYKKVLTGIATAYSGDTSTATGATPGYGTVAVDPRIIPYGSRLWIVTSDGSFTYGLAAAEDTGGFIYWNNAPIADLFFETEAECVAFGRQQVTIYVLD